MNKCNAEIYDLDRFEPGTPGRKANTITTDLKRILSNGLVRPANGFITEGKRTKHAAFGYPMTKFSSSDARDSSDRFVERICHIMTIHQTGVSVRFVRWKVLNMLKIENRSKRTSPDIAGQEAYLPDQKRT